MSNDTTQHTPAEVRERVVDEIVSTFRTLYPHARGLVAPAAYAAADRILALLRTPRGEGEGDALGMLQASVDEYLWEAQNNPQFDAEAAFAALSREIRAALRSEAQGEDFNPLTDPLPESEFQRVERVFSAAARRRGKEA